MSFGEAIAPLVGRLILAGFFILSGLYKLQNWQETGLIMAQHGIEAIQPLLALAILVEVGAGAGIILGFRTRLMALVLFVFTIVVSFAMHDFWTMSDPELRSVEAQLFAKNVAIAGGLLLLLGFGAGRWSYDSWRGD